MNTGVSLSKGQKVDLTKNNPSLKILNIGCVDTLFKPIDKKALYEKVAALAR